MVLLWLCWPSTTCNIAWHWLYSNNFPKSSLANFIRQHRPNISKNLLPLRLQPFAQPQQIDTCYRMLFRGIALGYV